MFVQVSRGLGKASDLLEPYQITRLQKVGRIKPTQQFGRGGFPFLTNELECLRWRLALYQHTLAIETMCRFPLPASNSRPKRCAGRMGSDRDFNIVGHHLDILNLTAMPSSSPLD